MEHAKLAAKLESMGIRVVGGMVRKSDVAKALANTGHNAEVALDLEEISSQMSDLLEQAMQLLQSTPERDRAKSTWYAHIKMALSRNHDFLGGGSATTMADTIDALKETD